LYFLLPGCDASLFVAFFFVVIGTFFPFFFLIILIYLVFVLFFCQYWFSVIISVG